MPERANAATCPPLAGCAFFGSLSRPSTPFEPGMTVPVQPGVDKPATISVARINAITATGPEELAHPCPRRSSGK